MSSKKKFEANRKNAQLSTGPKTQTGKNNIRLNALKDGFYAQELIVRPENKEEIEQLRKGLQAQMLPKTALQQIGFKAIVHLAWQCELGARLDMRRVNAAIFPPDPQESSPYKDGRPLMDKWFGSSPEEWRKGIRFLDRLKDEVGERGEVPEGMKDSVRKGFGPRFLDLLEPPKSPINRQTLLLAHMLAHHEETFKQPLPPETREGPEVIVDPEQGLRATLNVIELMREFLEDLRQINRLAGQENARVNASDSPPRHFADAARELHRAVAWYQYLVANKL
jgi:hypothetical protein